ncbi:alpha/beta-hydrolase family protein [Nocardia veterana]|nr:alpha/beta-hydrolase family protein [Nocardia veterana]
MSEAVDSGRNPIGWRHGVVAAVVAVVVLTILSAWPPAARAAAAGQRPEDAAARAAVLALTGDRPDRAAVPADFAATQGYRPVQLDGTAVDPGGECSSPIRLPAEFDTACKAHDLGYDLLRYAESHGRPLGPWARRAIDNALETRMFDACAARTDVVARLRCTTMATVATAAVDLNSRRQNYAAPMPEYLFGRRLSGTDIGPQLVHVPAALAMVLLLTAALFAVVRRLIRPGRRPAASIAAKYRAPLGNSPDAVGSTVRSADTGARHARFGRKRPRPTADTAPGQRIILSNTTFRGLVHRPFTTSRRIGATVTATVAGLRAAAVRHIDNFSAWFGTPAVAVAGSSGNPWRTGPAVGALRTGQPDRGSARRRASARTTSARTTPTGAAGPEPAPAIYAVCRNVLRALARRAARTPRVGTVLAVGCGVAASLAPGLLPRTSIAQALLTALLVLIALALAGVGRKVLRPFGIDTEQRLSRYRRPIAAISAVGTTAAVGHAWFWQNRLRAAMDFPAVGPGYWLRWAVGVVSVVVPVLLLARGLRQVAGHAGRIRAAALVTATVLACQFAVLPTLVTWQRASFAAADAAVDPSLVQPVSYTRSGSPDSVVSWSSLGAEGRKFVAERGRSVRIYIGLASAPDLDSRVALALRELERSGGFERGHLVMMVPTGSGWLDAKAARGLDERFDGDATLIGMQYSQAPSWATFLFARAEAERSARALFTAIERRLATVPHPPKLYIYGQSLGATAGSAVFADDDDERSRVCAALWAGPPVATAHRGSATILANSSDPVVQWSPRLLWRAPDSTGTHPDAPRPPWLPVLSWVQTTADMLSALAPGPGHGHRYGTDQGTALGSC